MMEWKSIEILAFIWTILFALVYVFPVPTDATVPEVTVLDDLRVPSNETLNTPPDDRLRREADEGSLEPKPCPQIEVPKNPGLHLIKEVQSSRYTFHFKPKTARFELRFYVKVDNTWSRQGSYYIKDTFIDFYSSDFSDDVIGTWIPVTVAYFKQVIRFHQDKIALRVTVGDKTRTVVTKKWWRTHDFKGFSISADGPGSFLFECLPPTEEDTFISNTSSLISRSLPEEHVTVLKANNTVLLGAGVALGFLVLVLIVSLYLMTKRRNQPSAYEGPPAVPPLPESLLLKGNGKAARSTKGADSENIYDEFDEDKLNRLRQQFSTEKFNGARNYKENESGLFAFQNDINHENASFINENASNNSAGACAFFERRYQNPLPLRLLEEKQRAWEENPQGDAPQSQYLEMHGIIRRESIESTLKE